MKATKAFSVVMIVLMLVLSMGLLNTAQAADKYVMRFHTATSGNHPMNYYMERFKAAIEPKLGGKLDVQLYPSSQLGGNVTVMQLMQNGAMEAGMVVFAFVAGLAPAATVVEMPGFIPNSQTLERLVASPAGDPVREYVQKNGFELLTCFGGVERVILSRPSIDNIEQLKGKKIRIMGAKMHQMEMTALGAVPVAMDVPELMTAFQQGTVDGIESDVLFLYTSKFYELAKTLVMEPRAPLLIGVWASKIWMDKLPQDMREAVRKTAIEVNEKEVKPYVKKMAIDCFNGITSSGVKVYETPPEARKGLVAKYAAIPEAFLKEVPSSKPIYDSLWNAYQKSK